MSIYNEIFNLSLGEIVGLCFVGYLIVSGILFLLESFFRFCAWGFHILLARIAELFVFVAEEMEKDNNSDTFSDVNIR